MHKKQAFKGQPVLFVCSKENRSVTKNSNTNRGVFCIKSELPVQSILVSSINPRLFRTLFYPTLSSGVRFQHPESSYFCSVQNTASAAPKLKPHMRILKGCFQRIFFFFVVVAFSASGVIMNESWGHATIEAWGRNVLHSHEYFMRAGGVPLFPVIFMQM